MIRLSTALGIWLSGSLAMGAVAFATDRLVRFANPSLLVLLTIPVVLLGLFCATLVWRGRVAAWLGDVATVQSMTHSLSGRRMSARATLVIVASLLLALAAARPQWGEQTRSVSRQGIDVVFAIDVSNSMLAGDVPPSRLRATIAEMDRLMTRLQGDRVGLVVFAGIAFVQSPLTSDYGAIRLYLDRLSPDAIPMQGTAIGRAIHEATRLLTGSEDDPNYLRANNQIIIVFSDGEDHETDPVAAAQAAREQGIDVYTVGVGTAAGGQIPIRRADGSLQGYFRDRNGEIVVTRLEEEQLQAIADAGGGAYLSYGAEGAAAAALDRAIESYDAEALSSALRQQYRDRFMLFLIPALLLLLLATALGDRKRGAGLLGALLLLGLVGGCDTSMTRLDRQVEQAMALLEAGDMSGALELLGEASANSRDQAEYHYNLGLVLNALERYPDAQENFLKALQVREPGRQVSALFALGNVLLAQDQFEAAIERYRRALLLDPSHDGARRNLEIALLKLYPPCVTLEDEFEINNEPGSAASLSPAVYQGTWMPPGVEKTGSEEAPKLVACGGDPDWYAIPVVGGATLDVEVQFQRLRDDRGHEALPAQIDPSRVRITLVEADGTTHMATDNGVGEALDSEPVRALRLTRSLAGVPVSPLVDSGSLVYLQVEVDGELEYSYEVKITLTPPCWALEDQWEPNDSRSSATRLDPSGAFDGRLCASNDDWFTREVGPEDALFMDLTPLRREEGEPAVYEASFFEGEVESPHQRVLVGEEGASFEIRDPGEETRGTVRLSSVDQAEGSYRLEAWHFEPCPVGNDRFEPNDDYREAAQIGGEDAPLPLRHLRLCEDDVDWYVLPLPEVDEEEREEQERRPFSALVEINGPPADVEIVVYDAGTGQLVAQGVPVSAAPAGALLSEPELQAVVAWAELPWEVEAVLVGVAGEQTFYHLDFPHTQQQEQQQQEGGSGDSQEEPQEEAEGDPENQEDSQGDPEDQSDNEREEEAPESDDPEEDAADEPTDEELQREALLQLLEGLEADDVNLPLQQALEAAPPQRFLNEW